MPARKKAGVTSRGVTDGDVALGEKIRTRRSYCHMSQSELGDQLGISFQQIQKYEKGTNRVSATRLAQIAGVLGESLSYFQGDGKTLSSSGREIQMLLSDKLNLRTCRALSAIEDMTLKQQFVRIIERIAGVHEDE